MKSTAMFGALALLATTTAWAGGPGTLKFDEDTLEVLEGAGTALVVVERSQGEDGAVTVDYTATAGTATNGSDFVSVSGTLSWGDQDGGSRTFEVPILQDSEAEPDETIDLTLSNATLEGDIYASDTSIVRLDTVSHDGEIILTDDGTVIAE